eukprot:XP_017447853.1 PREDICTED: ankyrin repeat and BTB/POZ domain-containing protein 2-like [Rattus norvegicus]
MLMQYLYYGGTESMEIPTADILQLLSAANLFQLDALQRHCEILCSQTLSVESAVNTYKYAKVRAGPSATPTTLLSGPFTALTIDRRGNARTT